MLRIKHKGKKNLLKYSLKLLYIIKMVIMMIGYDERITYSRKR